MIIHKLTIQAFGQFTNKTFEFSEGLNVMYGLNETGKTTLHAFIEGILYGFFNPTVKVRKTLEAYDIYKPKNSGAYGGSITLELHGKHYVIKRDLLKNTKDGLTVLNDKTGEDITNTLDIHPVTKQADIEKFINIPYLLYQNTLSISALPTESDTHVGDLLLNRLQNIMTTKTETISTSKALESLASSLKDIGSETARTKPYAKALKHLTQLEDEKTQALETYNTLLDKKSELEDHKEAMGALERDLNTYKDTLKKQENERLKRMYKDAKSIQTSIDEKNVLLKTYEPYKTFDSSSLETYLTLTNKIDNSASHIKSKQNDIETTKQAIETLSVNLPETPFDLKQMKADQKTLYQAYRDYDDTVYETLKKEKAQLEKEKAVLAQKRKQHILKQTPIGKLFTWVIKILLFVVYLPRHVSLNKRYTKICRKLEHVNLKLDPMQNAKDTMSAILSRYDVSTVDMFDTVYNQTQTDSRKQTILLEKQATLKTLQDTYSTLVEEQNTLKTKLKKLKDTYQIDDYDALKALNQNRITYDDMKKEIGYLTKRLEDKLNGRSLDDLKRAIDPSLESMDPSSLEETKETMKHLAQKVNDKRLTIERASSYIKNQETMHRPLEVITHDIAEMTDKIQALEDKKNVIENAIAMIETGAKKIEENFAPVISEHIKAYLAHVTIDRYHDIKVSKQLTFKVYDKRYHALEAKTHFSKGTKDQVYFAMRLGILDALKHETMPLLLDDAFSNFDKERLKQALITLDKMAKTRQILLFTCHTREETILKASTIKATYHTLT